MECHWESVLLEKPFRTTNRLHPHERISFREILQRSVNLTIRWRLKREGLVTLVACWSSSRLSAWDHRPMSDSWTVRTVRTDLYKLRISKRTLMNLIEVTACIEAARATWMDPFVQVHSLSTWAAPEHWQKAWALTELIQDLGTPFGKQLDGRIIIKFYNFYNFIFWNFRKFAFRTLESSKVCGFQTLESLKFLDRLKGKAKRKDQKRKA